MRFFLIFSFSLLVACGDDKSDTGADAVASDTDADAFAPNPGTWSWDGTEYGTDECGLAADFEPETIDAALWDLVLTDDGFSLDNEVWTEDPIQCVVTGMDFSCTSVLVVAAEAWPEGSENDTVPDATFTTTGTVTGVFNDAETGSVGLVTSITCEGADCEALTEERGQTRPCTTDLSGSFDRE